MNTDEAAIEPNQSSEPLDHNPDEENLVTILASISRRLDALESRFSFQGLDILAIEIEKHIVNRLRIQTGVR